MSMIAVRNFRGIEHADITCEPVAVLGGRNRQGKTSILEAVGAAVARQPIAYVKTGATADVFQPRLTKTEAKKLVHDGQKAGSVAVVDEDGEVRITWPDCDIITTGAPAWSSPYAAGLIDILSLDEKKLSGFLFALLDAAPTKDDLARKIKDENISEKLIDQCWGIIEEQGWDVAEKKLREHGATMKGHWEAAVAPFGDERYGASKAEGWTPPDWDEHLAAATQELLDKKLAEAQAAYDKAIRAQAVDENEIERLREAAGRPLPDLKALKDAADALCQQRMAAEKERAALPDIDSNPGLPCPHCGERVLIKRVNDAEQHLVKHEVEKLSDVEIKKRRGAIAAADGKIENLRAETDRAYADHAAAFTVAENIRKAREALAEAEKAQKGDGGDVEPQKIALDLIKLDRAKWTAWTAASAYHARIKRNQIIIDALKPDGVRKARMLRAIAPFNERLDALSRQAKWPSVNVTADMEIRLGDRPDFLMSASEKAFVRAVLQIAIAEWDKSVLVIVDALDIFDGGNKTPFFKMLMGCGKNVLVAGTMNGPDNLPPLEAKGWGHSYWVEEGFVYDRERALARGKEQAA